MKKFFLASLMMLALSLNVNAQKNNEVYMSLSPITSNLPSGEVGSPLNKKEFIGLTFGYNHAFDLGDNSNFKFILGAKLMYWGYIDENKTIDGKEYDNLSENYFRVSVPVIFKYVINVNENVSIEPFAGLSIGVNTDASYDLKKDSRTLHVDMFGENDGLKRMDFGAQVGVDLGINRFVLGLSYNPSFSNYYSKGTHDGKWNEFDVKFGYRF